MSSNIAQYENSVQDGQPIECYAFYCDGIAYLYTSTRYDVELPVYDANGHQTGTNKFFADYVDRQSIKPASKGDSTALAVTLSKDNPVAKLFQTTPPEKGVIIEIYRLHAQNTAKYDRVFRGSISQGTFKDSKCTLSVNMGSWLNKQIPNMMKQYYCCNVLFDSKCRLNKDDWAVNVFIALSDNHMVKSSNFAAYPDGYFTGGRIIFQSNSRMIRSHVGDTVTIQYPFNSIPVNSITAYPGCAGTYKTCVTKFNNDNFSGCAYVPPTNPVTTNVGTGVYWADSAVVARDTECFVGTISI